LNAIILGSGKQFDEPKVTQGEEGECVVKPKSKSLMEEEIDVIPEDKEQGEHEEVPRPRVVEPHDPHSLSPNVLQKPNLRSSLENTWRCSKSYKSAFHSLMPFPRCPLMPNSL